MYQVTKALKSIVAQSDLYIPVSMLSVNADAKTVKGTKKGFLTGIMYLAPNATLCPSAKAADCLSPCLYTAGRGKFTSVQLGRINKTKLLDKHPEIAMVALWKSINGLVNKAAKQGLQPVVRLNGTSDIDWTTRMLDGKTLFQHFPDVQFYDYTKRPNISRKASFISNYDVTVSYSSAAAYTPVMSKLMKGNDNIAVVFDGGLPDTFLGLPVIDGDDSDLRFLDKEEHKERVVVGLKAKGDARGSDSALVVNTNIIAVAA